MSEATDKNKKETMDIQNPYLKSTILKLLKTKINENHGLPRKTTSFQINTEVAQEFYRVIADIGIATPRQGANKVIEAYMSLMCQAYRSDEKQTKLQNVTNVLIKVQNLSIGERLDLKVAKEDLNAILKGFERVEQKKVDSPKEYTRHLNSRLKKVLPRATHFSLLTKDPELNRLLVAAEKRLA